MSVKIRILKNELPRLSARVKQDVADALNRAAAETETIAKTLAPVATGFLRNSIQQTSVATANNLRAEVTIAAECGAMVELGTTKRAATPFMTPAFDAAAPDLKNELDRILK